MRTAILADIHGNRTALEAVIEDMRQMSPDLIPHGGDLSDGGAGAAEIVDRIRDLGWQGVMGNTDEMLFRAEKLGEIAAQSPKFQPLFAAIEEMATATRELLGEERIAWLRSLPQVQTTGELALVHGTPQSAWRAPAPEAADTEFESVYGPLAKSLVAYGHIHRPFVRNVGGMIIANTGSVGLSYDGDSRASYLIVDDLEITIRRVEYDVEAEIRILTQSGFPHADWIANTLRHASVQTL
jgi:putative phosphoesterase